MVSYQPNPYCTTQVKVAYMSVLAQKCNHEDEIIQLCLKLPGLNVEVVGGPCVFIVVDSSCKDDSKDLQLG